MKSVVLPPETNLADLKAGEIVHIGDKALAAGCPGCGQRILLQLKPNHSPSWRMEEFCGLITLSPSIVHDTTKGGCGWHGWLRMGEWLRC